MPSIKMRSFFKKKNKNSPTIINVKSLESSSGDSHDRSTPPMITPIDPDGSSTVSHSSNEFHPSDSDANNDASPSPASPPAGDPATAPSPRSATRSHADDEGTDDREDESPRSLPSQFRTKRGETCQTRSREGVPIVTSFGSDHFSPSAVGGGANYATDGFYSRSKKTFGGKERPRVRPSAKSSAFGGAPRYDWMDIETTAAVKIQASYRRLRVQNLLDEQNRSTPGMRNRRARREAGRQSRMSRSLPSADVPFPFSLCGVGLIFGDGTLEDERVVDGLERERAGRRKAACEREDEEKRRFRMRRKESRHLEEGIEVVESFDKSKGEEGEARQEGEGKEGGGSPRRAKVGRSKSRSKNRSKDSPGRSPSASLSPGGRRSFRRSRSKKTDEPQNDYNGDGH